MPLNGATAITEGARLQRLINACPRFIPRQGNEACWSPKASIQVPITPSENSRVLQRTANYNGTLLNGGGVTQERAKQLLANMRVQNFGSEGARINQVIQDTVEASTDPTSPTARFSMFNTPIVIPPCPPLPPPPAPPARACVLAKNQKLGGQ